MRGSKERESIHNNFVLAHKKGKIFKLQTNEGGKQPAGLKK